MPSLDAAYRVGSRVTHELVAHWAEYSLTPPAAK
jgi:purine nucleoside permease